MSEFEKLLSDDCLRIAERDYPATIRWVKQQLDKGVEEFDIRAYFYNHMPEDVRFVLRYALKALV